jgi:excisionase family DNA binding protein
MDNHTIKQLDKGVISIELPEMISVSEIRKHLHISEERVYKLIKTKGFPLLQIGHRYYIQKDKYLKWLEENYKGKILL